MQFKLSQLFDFEQCGRCQGRGEYSYNQVDGTVCYDCLGAKVRPVKKHARLYADFTAAVRGYTQPTARNLRAGDEAAWFGSKEFARILSVETTPGTEAAHSGRYTRAGVAIFEGWQVITYESGKVEKIPEAICMRRKFNFEGALTLCAPATVAHIRARLTK